MELDELDAAIAEAKTKAELHYSSNPQVIEQYEKRETEIQELQSLNNEEGGILEAKKQKMEEIKVSTHNLIIRTRNFIILTFSFYYYRLLGKEN
jgi:hypothetical protein